MDIAQRQVIRNALKDKLENLDIEGLVQQHGTPLILFDAQRMRQQYQRLQRALPGVRFYFALKAAGHVHAVEVINSCDGYLDVATAGEIDLVKSADFPIDRCMHTHPIKKPSEIAQAYREGLRRFVIENKSELKKFAGFPDDVELLVRLSFPNPKAGSDLSYKFGATENDAKDLVRLAKQQGTQVVGFCLHVGSQIDTAEAYKTAISRTLAIMDELEEELGITFTVLDIGGGFPVEYRESVPTLELIAEQIRPLIEPLMDRLIILAEPGRFVAAPSAMLITSVVGTSLRHERPWYYLDDGLYGTYSIVIYDGMKPHLFAYKELTGEIPAEHLQQSVLAGPTCDSIDVVAKDYPMPELSVGDLLVSPMMGAYSNVSATTFNGIPTTKIIPISSEDLGSAVEMAQAVKLANKDVPEHVHAFS